MNQIPLLVFSSLCIFTLSTTTTIAEVFRWTDDSGTVVFGDTPPKDKNATAVSIESTKNSGTRFASPGQVKNIENDAQNRRQQSPSTSQPSRSRIDSYCRRYISELNKVEIFLEHSNSQRDQNKARDLRKLISKECGNEVLTLKFDDGRCTNYRKALSKTEVFLEHTSSPRDEWKVKDLKKQIARECQ